MYIGSIILVVPEGGITNGPATFDTIQDLHRKAFRIPDYQRGYAWTEKQLKDFWTDIQQLEPGRNHYTGVLTLESVPEDVYR